MDCPPTASTHVAPDVATNIERELDRIKARDESEATRETIDAG